ncbi:hypothetical protein [Paludisphaera rhizosphaerae]|uniref:hypothetical protein n=1 Tax=Paludisphaera rhizosphaerae TaxID=2711216 RepID=UPI0013EDE933|nr:hypothetical protein [Paludisphaera rhizosphaerae]
MTYHSGRRTLRASAVALWAAGLTASASGGDAWTPGRPTPIAVHDGVASFSAPNDGEGGDLLVVVSSLSREAGPFPLRLSARSAESAQPPEIAAPGIERRPTLAPFRPDPEPAPPPAAPASRRDFHIMAREGDVGVAANYEKVHGVLRAVGERVAVYVAEGDLTAVDDATLTDVVETFDRSVLPVASRSIGVAADVDGDGRFAVLFSSWLTRLGGGRHAVDGYVRVTDLDPSYPPPFGDRCDVMHLSTALRAGPHLRTVVAHEYTHAVVFTRKSRRAGESQAVEEGWLDEGLAHLCEDLHGFGRSNVDYRVSAFLSRPEHYRLLVDDYYAADLFRSHGNRGSTYLFLRWCADRYGPDLLPTLVGSNLHGAANLEAATGRRFEDLFREWSVDLFTRGEAAAYSGFDSRPAGPWLPAGPRPSRTTVDGTPDAWDAAGTSPHYALIDAGRAKAVEIRVEGPADAKLQVTAARLPRSSRLTLTARTYRASNGDLVLRASAKETGGAPARLVALSWEPLTPPADARRSPLRPGKLDMEKLSEAFGADALPAAGSLDSLPIRLDPEANAGPLVVKLLALDPSGRPVAAWAELVDDRPEVARRDTAVGR